MNIEQKIVFRSLISDVLMYMLERSRTQGEILEVQEKLDRAVTQLINDNLRTLMPGQVYMMGPADKTEFRITIAGSLNIISQPGCNAEKVMELIKSHEAWIEEKIEATLRHAVGKPKMTITNKTTGRTTDLPN